MPERIRGIKFSSAREVWNFLGHLNLTSRRFRNFFGTNKGYKKRLRGVKISMENLRGAKISVQI